MKILEEDNGRPTIIQLDPEDSAIIFESNGEFHGFIPTFKDDEIINAGAWEAFICMVARADPKIRKMIEKSIRKE